MVLKTEPDECAVLIAENNNEVRAAAKSMHRLATDPRSAGLSIVKDNTLPLKRIRDTVHFAEKDEAPMLQLADVCAYTLSRFAKGAAHSAELLRRLTPAPITREMFERWGANLIVSKR
jgi:hypothetical protein